MFFITLLMLAAFGIAGTAAYFSVFGLANTFHGTFWAVVLMGGALEYGKLIATSFLYRFWGIVGWMLKVSLLFLVGALMLITSLGIFGFLSTGYQTDSLPTKQIEQKVILIEQEKSRLIERKQQIDNQIASLPADTAKGRISLIKGFKDEQKQVTDRINILDAEELETKTKLIQSEAHIGPIAYIARAMGASTDDATKYLIYLIIFVFDPMAVTLTLAVNIAVREREKHQLKQKIDVHIVDETNDINITSDGTVDIHIEPIIESDNPISIIESIPEELVEHSIPEKIEEVNEEIEDTILIQDDTINSDQVPEILPESEEIIEPQLMEEPQFQTPPRRATRMYAGVNADAPIEQLIEQYHYYKNKIDNGEQLSLDDNWSFTAVRDHLQKRGLNIYL